MPHLYNRHHGDAPPDALYIGRGTPAGNPFIVGRDGTRDECCDKFEAWVEEDPEVKRRIIEYCRGHHLLCSCKPKRCHGDYCLRVSNEKKPRYTYAIGFKDANGAYGMIYGPTESLRACLDFSPDEVESRGVCYVLEYDGGLQRGTNRIVARWRPSTSSWVQRK